MFKKLLVSTASAATIALAACGGGGGADPVSTPPPTGGGNNPPPAAQYNVAGPMDAVQAPMSSTAFGQLEAATEGTPLKALLVCADRAINHDALDFADTIANALQSAAAAGSSDPAAIAGTAAQLNASVNQLANDVQGLLNALAATGGGCGANGLPVGALAGTNPLAGTPLAPLGTELQSVLFTIRNAHNAGSVLSLGQLSSLVGDLSSQFSAGIAGVNTLAPDLGATPMISGVLVSVQQTLADLDGLMQAITLLDSAAVKASLNALLDNALANQLTRVVPLRFVELQAGQAGVLSTPVLVGTADVADLFTTTLGTVFTTQALKNALAGELDTVLDPIATEVLPVLSTQIVAALFNAETATGPTGTPLDLGLGALSTMLGPVGGAGQPVDTLLSLIAGSVQSGAGGLPICPSPVPLLNLLCGL